MKTLITASQMQAADKYTIENTSITSLELMENAAAAFVKTFVKDIKNLNTSIAVFCGKGNNGGDGLTIGRLLIDYGFLDVNINVVDFSDKRTEDFSKNLQRLEENKVEVFFVKKPDQIYVNKKAVIIDAIFGSGLNKPLNGDFELFVANLNSLKNMIYSVDVPSGFFADGKLPTEYNGVKAYKTICFQRPKINFFFPESIVAIKHVEVVNIDLEEKYLQNLPTDFFLTEKKDIEKALKPRTLFSHKGTYGHALLVAGNENTMGAALLCAAGCLKAGAGLTTACIPKSGFTALNTLLPEVMAIARNVEITFENIDQYQVIGIGPGLGKSVEHLKLLENLLNFDKPMVLDADALNMLSDHKELITRIPRNSIITPHIKEFDRLFGTHADWWSRVETAKQKSKELEIIIVLKNQYTFVCLTDGTVHINSTGNPAMAQGGMGDILTGIICSFLAQKYKPKHAAILACYLHGKAGDSLAKKQYVVSASDVAKRVSKEIGRLI